MSAQSFQGSHVKCFSWLLIVPIIVWIIYCCSAWHLLSFWTSIAVYSTETNTELKQNHLCTWLGKLTNLHHGSQKFQTHCHAMLAYCLIVNLHHKGTIESEAMMAMKVAPAFERDLEGLCVRCIFRTCNVLLMLICHGLFSLLNLCVVKLI